MSTDRIFLSCPECSSRFLVYKYNPGGGHVPFMEDFADKLDGFIDKHLNNCLGAPETLSGNARLLLTTESQPAYMDDSWGDYETEPEC